MKNFDTFAFATICALAMPACGDDGSGNTAPQPDANNPTAPDAAPMMPCDTASQTGCPDPASPKCTVGVDSMGNWIDVCRAQTGAIAEGVHCTREAEGDPGEGKDDCAGGLYCTYLGNVNGSLAPADRHCRKFCNGPGVCDAGKTCLGLTDLLTPDGVCVDVCTVFTNAGCTEGAWCYPYRDIQGNTTGACLQAGTKTEGQECTTAADCAQNLDCVGGGFCRAVCSLANPPDPNATPCPAMSTCMSYAGFDDVGVCLPI